MATMNETTNPAPPALSSGSWISNNLTTTAITIIVISLLTAFLRVSKYRRSVLEANGSLKMLPQGLLFGNIPSMASIYETSPMDTHPQGSMTLLRRKFGLGNIFFLDNWPAARAQLCIIDPEVATQVTQTRSLPKAQELRKYVGHLCGPTSLLYTEGAEWKKTRSLFNPGFAAAHLSTLIPSIVDDTAIYVKILEKHANAGKVIQLEEDLAHLTIDIMGHVVLDHDLNSQTQQNDLVDCFRETVSWTPSTTQVNPLVTWNPVLPIAHWYYARRMDRYIGDVLDARYVSKAGQAATKNKRKPAIDLALDEYVRQSEEEGKPSTGGIDPTFRAQAIDQMKTFLFAGHDTSSSTICFIYHLLSRHPEAAAKVREEHDHIFGKDRTQVGNLLKQDPTLINKLPFSLAVIKETLRLFPPASSVRQGDGGTITHEGKTYPTGDMMVWVISHAIHRRADLFPRPDEFIPERFLPAPDNWQEVPKDAWRPFEKGPRNCIGQELAVLEMKIIMAMTCRLFDIEERYADWDRKLGRKNPGDTLGGKRGMFGDRVYQVLIASAKPADGFPAMVTKRVQGSNSVEVERG